MPEPREGDQLRVGTFRRDLLRIADRDFVVVARMQQHCRPACRLQQPSASEVIERPVPNSLKMTFVSPLRGAREPDRT